ncbi:hypothetical protein SAMN05444274_10659 [Mariniphaga anaerophila]|uniref:Uncharacterized protein n=1 Tax=Mariniphaga anaerophila TaxID=1484053 RepID=A0A1M5CCQ7_9BACT|nr:hypothetical protein [Mariniphaga anaerophila]SHF52501.1 hypothetical protein SAMN05444274_10659 [Mariniphaga anaerophila]
MRIITISVLFFLGFVVCVNAQEYFRISVDFTTKTKPAEGKANLTKGKVYYDKYTKELIYDIQFPEKEKWIVQDSRMYKLVDDSVYFGEEIPSLNEFTVFHLSLNSNLSYFGLDQAQYTIGKVEKNKDLIVTYWNIPQQIQEVISSIAVARKGNSLYSVIIADENNQIRSKQFFKDYIKKGGFEFPGTIVQIFYDENQQESYQVMEFKNIVLNDNENESNYHYRLDK